MDALFNPHAIAVIGASNNPLKAGYTIIENLKKKNYAGKVFPVHPTEDTVQGIRAFKNLSEIDSDIDLVVLIMPSKLIFSVMEDLEAHYNKRKDIRYIVCAAADFAETRTPEGIARQEALMSTASRCGIRVMGPNCIGVINNKQGVDTTFVDTGVVGETVSEHGSGGISFISQSGSIASIILMLGDSAPVPMKFNKFISIGNMADLDFLDFLEYLEHDESTKTIGIYLEGYPEGKKLLGAMARIALKKPIVVLKVGRSVIGSQAASSHTGSMAGADEVYSAAFKQYGIVRVNTIDEMFDTLRAFDELPRPKSEHIFVCTQAGGPGIYCTDAIEETEQLIMTDIEESTIEQLVQELPPMAVVNRPVGYADITAAATIEQHARSVEILLKDPNVSSLVFISVIPSFLQQPELGIALERAYSNSKSDKPVYYIVMSGNYVLPTRKAIEEKGIPTYSDPQKAIKALNHVVWYERFIRRDSCEVS